MIQFNYSHYVPILRWKRAEQGALRCLTDSQAASITPLLELVPKAFTNIDSKGRVSVDKGLSKIASDINRHWPELPAFIDLCHLSPRIRSESGRHLLVELGMHVSGYGGSLIPVTGLGRDAEYQAAVNDVKEIHDQGVCIRLLLADILKSHFKASLDDLLKTLHISPKNAHLMLDLQVINGTVPNLVDIANSIPYLEEWRTFTIASGAFPLDLSDFTKNRQHTIPRHDWMVWQTLINTPGLLRKPSYADYTVQHPVYSEPAGFRNFSASIRYTYDAYWVIMRGEGVFNDEGPGFAQWPANAELLVNRDEFCGADFSHGDSYIYSMCSKFDRPGNATTWLQAGINHHMAYVTHQLAA